jgi:tyrosine-protein kinase Etk/Wzc
MEDPNNIKTFEQEDRMISFDPGKFNAVLRKSFPWILLLFLIAFSTSFLVIRYTKPLYESRSVLKLDIKSEASLLGLNNLDEEKSYNNLLSEIELLKSKLFYNKIIDAVDLNVNVFTIGNILDDERYHNAPFKVEYKLEHPEMFDLRFRVQILNPRSFNLSYTFQGKNYNSNHDFGETIRTDNYEIRLLKTPFYDPDARDSEFFFRINSRSALLEYIEENFNVEPLKLNTNTIEISFQDYNRQKARDLANAIDTIYLKYTKEEKTKANSQKVEFLNLQLESTEQKLSDFEGYFEDFIIHNKTTDLQSKLDETIKFMNEIDSHRYQLQIKLTRLEALKSSLDSGTQINLGIGDLGIIPGEVLDQINELNELLDRSETILLSYNRNTQAYRLRTNEINALYQKIQNFIDEYILSIKRQLGSLSFQKATLEKNFVELPSKNTEYSKSQRYYSLYEEFYLSLPILRSFLQPPFRIPHLNLKKI